MVKNIFKNTPKEYRYISRKYENLKQMQEVWEEEGYPETFPKQFVQEQLESMVQYLNTLYEIVYPDVHYDNSFVSLVEWYKYPRKEPVSEEGKDITHWLVRNKEGQMRSMRYFHSLKKWSHEEFGVTHFAELPYPEK